MASFERVLMPGLDKDRTAMLGWYGTGAAGLISLIPNGAADWQTAPAGITTAPTVRLNAWQTIERRGGAAANAPENRRALVTPSRASGSETGSCPVGAVERCR
ncbi:hypothetical protein [Pantoea stewartii]|uniref:hypothetical protein n=1 Tax=Pantoea stewartii TaxID=66269 RepID=UPI0025A1953D|nr:hypothetical protein [Pantoea stewartii]